MPRQGEGHIAHNAVDPNVNQVAHGAGEATVSRTPFFSSFSLLGQPCTSRYKQEPNADVDRKQPNEVAGAKKAAPMPEQQKGAGLEGVPASGGSSQGLKQGPEVGQGGARS